MSGQTLADQTERVRLHITPFNSELHDRIIPPFLQSVATRISFHTVQTFPECGFGYVELPRMEAEKLKKKLNGSILKGTKVRVEEAKPEKKRKVPVDETEEERKARKRAKKQKRKPEDGVLPGYELEEGRQVKRGWTEAGAARASKKKSKEEQEEKHRSEPSKYSKDKEMLFKTTLPENKILLELEKAKETRCKERREKKERRSQKIVVVHEFKNSTKQPSFIKQDAPKGAKTSRYEELVGWVDEEGKVVEGPKRNMRRQKEVVDEQTARPKELSPEESSQNGVATHARTSAEQATAQNSISGSSSEASEAQTTRHHQKAVGRKITQDLLGSSEDEDGQRGSPVLMKQQTAALAKDAARHTITHALAGNKRLPKLTNTNEQQSETPEQDEDTSLDDRSNAADSDRETIQPVQSRKTLPYKPQERPVAEKDAPKEIHPLEALFKRPASKSAGEKKSKPAPAPIDTSFKFFGNADGGEEGDGAAILPPQTPHTEQDLEFRNIRSAAPTPDTAAIGRKLSFPFAQSASDEDDEVDTKRQDHSGNAMPNAGNIVEAASAVLQLTTHGTEEESAFAKHFWENRGDINRAWKKIRREGKKAQRQAKNRQLSRRII